MQLALACFLLGFIVGWFVNSLMTIARDSDRCNLCGETRYGLEQDCACTEYHSE